MGPLTAMWPVVMWQANGCQHFVRYHANCCACVFVQYHRNHSWECVVSICESCLTLEQSEHILYMFWEHRCCDCRWPLQVSEKENECWTKRKSETGRERGGRKQHIGIHGWSQLTHPSLPHILYITFALQCSKCLTHSWWKRHVCSLKGSCTVDHAHTPANARMYAHAPSRRKNKLFFNCYMGGSDGPFSFYHTVMCIMITLGRKFNALLMACMEKKKSSNHKLPVK